MMTLRTSPAPSKIVPGMDITHWPDVVTSDIVAAAVDRPILSECHRAIATTQFVAHTDEVELLSGVVFNAAQAGRVISTDPIPDTVIERLRSSVTPNERLRDEHFHWPFGEGQPFVILQPGDAGVRIVVVIPGGGLLYTATELAFLNMPEHGPTMLPMPSVVLQLNGRSSLQHINQFHKCIDVDLDQIAADTIGIVGSTVALLNIGGIEWQDYPAKEKRGDAIRPAYTALKTGPYVTSIDPRPKRRGEAQGGTHASPVIHTRRPHLRRLPNGKTIWIRECIIVAGGKEGIAFVDQRIGFHIKSNWKTTESVQ